MVGYHGPVKDPMLPYKAPRITKSVRIKKLEKTQLLSKKNEF